MPVTRVPKTAKPVAAHKPAPKLVGTPLVRDGFAVQVFDAQKYVENRFGVGPKDSVRVFHHATDAWATPGEKATINTQLSDGMFGVGFYTARRPQTEFGACQFQLEIPVAAFKGKKILEWQGGQGSPGHDFTMPRGIDIMAVKGGYGRGSQQCWLIFKKGSDAWLNKNATQADFDKPGQTDSWD